MTKRLLHSERSGLCRIQTKIILILNRKKPPTSKLLLIEIIECHRIETNKRLLSSSAHFALADGIVWCHLWVNSLNFWGAANPSCSHLLPEKLFSYLVADCFIPVSHGSLSTGAPSSLLGIPGSHTPKVSETFFPECARTDCHERGCLALHPIFKSDTRQLWTKMKVKTGTICYNDQNCSRSFEKHMANSLLSSLPVAWAKIINAKDNAS